jgi:uncharacterized protein YgiM (DUF1202 family)
MRKLTTKITALALAASFTTGLCPMAIAASNSGSGAQASSSASAQADSAAGKSKSAAKTAEQKKSEKKTTKAKGVRKAPSDQSDAALGTGTVHANGKGYHGIYLRAKASQKGKILVKVPVDSQVEILADQDANGWYQVRYTDGASAVWSGYMAGDYVKTGVSKNPSATATVMKAGKVRRGVYIRADKSTDAKVLYKVPVEEAVTVLSQADEDGWYQVSYTDGLGSTYNGYMREEYVDTDNSAAAAEELTGVVTADYDFIYLRPEMDRASKPVCKVPVGRTVTVLDRSAGDGWYQVRYKNSKGAHKGYMVSKYVALDGVSNGTVETTSAVMRSAADSGSAILEVIPQDTKVGILAVVGDWYQVSYNGQVGYVDSSCFEKGAADAGNGYGTVIKDEVRLRSGRSTDAGILTTLKKGDTFRIIDVVDGWYETIFNGEQGYLKADNVSASDSVSSGYIQVIATPSVMLRKGAGTDFDELGTVPTGTLLKVVDTMGSWYKVKYGKKVGYVIGDNEYVSATTKDGFQAYPDYAKIVTDELSLREEPSEDGERITGIGEGMVVHVYDMENGWYRVTYGDDVGYIPADYTQEDEGPATPIPDPAEESEQSSESEEGSAGSTESGTSESTEPSEESSESSGGSGSSVLSYAEQFVGNPYQWGGSSLTNGCDCSGFVMSVYSHFGYSLPHSSAADRSVGRSVSESEMRPGDIVCYSGHVGIYAGNGQLLSALGEKYGITYNSVHYKKILAVRRLG